MSSIQLTVYVCEIATSPIYIYIRLYEIVFIERRINKVILETFYNALLASVSVTNILFFKAIDTYAHSIELRLNCNKETH